jgi:hypothetical protein
MPPHGVRSGRNRRRMNLHEAYFEDNRIGERRETNGRIISAWA